MSKITKESLLSYDEKRLLIFTSTCVGIALIIGFVIGYLIPPSQSKINNQALIQNFNKAHYNMLNATDFEEYSDDSKINFIAGYELGFQQGREQEISKYNQNKAQKQELLNIEKEITSLKLEEIRLDKFIKKQESKRLKGL